MWAAGGARREFFGNSFWHLAKVLICWISDRKYVCKFLIKVYKFLRRTPKRGDRQSAPFFILPSDSNRRRSKFYYITMIKIFKKLSKNIFKKQFLFCQTQNGIHTNINEYKAFKSNQFKVKMKIMNTCPNLLTIFGRV